MGSVKRKESKFWGRFYVFHNLKFKLLYKCISANSFSTSSILSLFTFCQGLLHRVGLLNSGYISFQIWLHFGGGIVIAELCQFLKESEVLDMEKTMQMCDDCILLEDINQRREESQQVGFHIFTAEGSWETFFFFLLGSSTRGECFGLAIYHINTKISGLPDVLHNILFIKYFKVFQMSRNLYCCVLLTRNHQELVHSQLCHHWLTLGGFAGCYTRDTWDWLMFTFVSINYLSRTHWLEVCWEYRLALGSLVSWTSLTGYLRIWCNEGEKEGCFSMSQKRFYFDGRTKWDFSLILRVIHWRNLFVGTSY